MEGPIKTLFLVFLAVNCRKTVQSEDMEIPATSASVQGAARVVTPSSLHPHSSSSSSSSSSFSSSSSSSWIFANENIGGHQGAAFGCELSWKYSTHAGTPTNPRCFRLAALSDREWSRTTSRLFCVRLGLGFCEFGSRVFREVWVADFAWSIEGKRAVARHFGRCGFVPRRRRTGAWRGPVGRRLCCPHDRLASKRSSS
jgi:hypothetical protein